MARAATAEDPYGLGLVSTIHDETYSFINPEKGQAYPINVLVTGASEGIGRATVKSFARAGATEIALLARSDLETIAREVLEAAKEAGRPEPKVLKLQVDMSDPVGVDKAMKQVEREFGMLDVVVNNASRLEAWHSFADTDVEDWWRSWEVNVKGTYVVTRAALPLVLKSNLKTIATVSSAGALSTHPGGSSYQSTKSAQIRLNDFLMVEYGDKGLNAFALHPGGVMTETALNMPKSMLSYLTQTPELSADTIVWLTKEKREWLAGRFVFGPLDMEQFLARKDEIIEKDLLELRLSVP